MCAIGAKHTKRFIVDVFTVMDIPEEAFLDMVREKIVQAEIELNKDASFRWHVKEG